MVSSFSDLDRLAVSTIRALSADVVQKANSGHPGAPMGCAPIAHVLFTRVMRFNPSNAKWVCFLILILLISILFLFFSFVMDFSLIEIVSSYPMVMRVLCNIFYYTFLAIK